MKFLSKRLVKALLLGLVSFVILNLIFSLLAVLSFSYILAPIDASHQSVNSESIILAINNLVWQIIFWLEVAAAGAVTAWFMKERGWFYGGLLGILFVLLALGVTLFNDLILPPLLYNQSPLAGFGYYLAQKNLLNQVISAPIIVLVPSLGGFLANKLYKVKTSY